MNQVSKITSGVVLLVFAFSQIAFAQMIDYARRNRYLHPSKPLPAWMQHIPKVTNATERRYDTNQDGLLQTAEVKIYLRDVIDEVRAFGSYKVDSNILKEYDTNHDGYIEPNELKQIKADAG